MNGERKLALFIDFENIARGVKEAQYKAFEIKLVLERLLEKGKIISRRAYADWNRFTEYKRPFHEWAIELIDVPQSRYSGKNSADIRMVVDALDLAYGKTHIDSFALVSGDSDFSPLVSKLRENDRYVIGLGVKSSSSDLLVANCDEFIFYEDLIRESKKTDLLRGLPEKKAEAMTQLIDAIQALQRENKETLWGSMVKQTMIRKNPAFNESYYGFATFSKLLEEAAKQKIVTLERDEKSGTYVITSLVESAIAISARLNSKPWPLPCVSDQFRKNPFGACTFLIATIMTTISPSATGRARNPTIIASPPKHSMHAAVTVAAAGMFIWRKPAMVFVSPGPPNQPKTFCAPCAKKIAPSISRTTRCDQEGYVPNTSSCMAPPRPLRWVPSQRILAA